MNTRPKNREARATFPQVGLQVALTSAFHVYSTQPGTHVIDEAVFRGLLGQELSTSALTRLLNSLKLYDLIDRRRNGYALTDRAAQLFATEDYLEFKSRLYDAAVFPPLMRELSQNYGDQLDSRKLEADLKSRQIAGKDKATLVSVLRENEQLLGHEQTSRTLFGTFSAFRQRSIRPTLGTGVAAARSWLKGQRGRTVMLSTVAVLFTGSLIYFATTRPTGQTASDAGASGNRTPRNVTAPVPEVSLPLPVRPVTTGTSDAPVKVSPTAEDLAAIGVAVTRAAILSATRPAPTAPAPIISLPPAITINVPRGAALAKAVPTLHVPTPPVPVITAGTVAQRPQVRTPGRVATGAVASTEAGLTSAGTLAGQPSGAGAALARTDATAATKEKPTPRTPVPTAGASGAGTLGAQASGTQVPGTVASAPPPTPATTAESRSGQSRYSDTLTRGRELAGLFYGQRLTPLWSAFSPAAKAEWVSLSAFQAYRAGGLTAFGAETTILVENVRQDKGVTYYTRTATFELGPRKPWTLIIGLNAQGQVVEFNVVAAAVLPAADVNLHQ